MLAGRLGMRNALNGIGDAIKLCGGHLYAWTQPRHGCESAVGGVEWQAATAIVLFWCIFVLVIQKTFLIIFFFVFFLDLFVHGVFDFEQRQGDMRRS